MGHSGERSGPSPERGFPIPAPDSPNPIPAPHRRFASLVLDVDSTLAGIEGIDWLAARRGVETAHEVAALTDRAMRGEIALDAVYGERLAMIRPSRAEVEALARAYLAAVAPGAKDVLHELREAGVRIALVSGGLRPAILPLARSLGVADDALHAVDVHFDAGGAFAGWDERSPLATQYGKAAVVAALDFPRPLLAVGDGATDLARRPAATAFAAYTGFVRREPVVRGADHEIDSFARLRALVLP